MLLVLFIHTTVLLTVTAQRNLTPYGTASQSSQIDTAHPKNAIEPPVSNEFDFKKCTHTYIDNNPAWWMFQFSFESAFITDITIYYRDGFSRRMDGFKLYVTNTTTIPPKDHLCYADPNSGQPNITQTIPCYELGKYVIYYDDTGSQENPTRYDGPVVELCYVAINGCQKSRWGSACEKFCTDYCIDRNCYPENGSCVWGCNTKNCLNDICDNDTAVCTVGCKRRRTGSFCNKYNIASDSLVSQYPSGSQPASRANDGDITTCSKTTDSSVSFQVDLKEKSIVTGLFILLGDGTTKTGHHTVYASNNSNSWNSGTLLYNGTFLPTEINFKAVFQFLTYVPPVQNPFTQLEVCEIGIIGCPPTHYGTFCNTTCPQNCHGPCDLESGNCKFGCMNGWTGVKCERDCSGGSYGKDCLETCSANCWNPKCNHVTGKCIGGCNDGWQGFNCSQNCPNGQFGRNCSGFCKGCVSSMCDSVYGLCDNETSCNPGYKYSKNCNIPCEDEDFGINCENRCYCLTGPCSKGDGMCPPGGCKEGWYGESCNKKCSNGYFGRNCKKSCKGCINNMCDIIDGICKNTTGCKPGYLYDEYCNKTCDDGYFGQNCTEKCICLTCNKTTGKCGGGTKSSNEEPFNVAAISGGVAAVIIFVLIIVAAFLFYKRRFISTKERYVNRTKSSDNTTFGMESY